MSSILSNLINLGGNVTGILAKTKGGTGLSSTATFPSSGVIVTEAASETLTNKDISSSTNTYRLATASQSGAVSIAAQNMGAGAKTFFNVNGTTQNATQDSSGNWTFGQTGIATGSFNASLTVGQPDFNGLTSGKTGGYSLRCGAGDTNGYDFDLLQNTFNGGSVSALNVGRNTAAVSFPQASTTASAANAFLSGASNTILKSTSSIRYKQDVQDLDTSSQLYALRPVTYRSKAASDDQSVRHLGLIAEDVAQVDTRLVQYVDGVADGVQYERLTVLLLSELKKLRTEFDAYKASHP